LGMKIDEQGNAVPAAPGTNSMSPMSLTTGGGEGDSGF